MKHVTDLSTETCQLPTDSPEAGQTRIRIQNPRDLLADTTQNARESRF